LMRSFDAATRSPARFTSTCENMQNTKCSD
jgi:hypothetical protein